MTIKEKGLKISDQGLNSKAETELLTAIEENPELAPAYFNLAVLYDEEGKKDRAEKLFQTTLDLDRFKRLD